MAQEISKSLLNCLNKASEKFQQSTSIRIGDAYQYATQFKNKSSVGSMGDSKERYSIFIFEENEIIPIGIEIGKSHHSNYAYEDGCEIDGETVKNYFSKINTGKFEYPEFILVVNDGYSNWEEKTEWSTVTIMPCGFSR